MMRKVGGREGPPENGTGKRARGDGGAFEVRDDPGSNIPYIRTQDILQVVTYIVALAAPFVVYSTLE